MRKDKLGMMIATSHIFEADERSMGLYEVVEVRNRIQRRPVHMREAASFFDAKTQTLPTLPIWTPTSRVHAWERRLHSSCFDLPLRLFARESHLNGLWRER